MFLQSHNLYFTVEDISTFVPLLVLVLVFLLYSLFSQFIIYLFFFLFSSFIEFLGYEYKFLKKKLKKYILDDKSIYISKCEKSQIALGF